MSSGGGSRAGAGTDTSMATADRVRELFADARSLHTSALERLEAGDIRDAAEKAWCATRRATDALILARTGNAPSTSSQTSGGIRALGQQSDALASLRSRFGNTAHYLHAECFYDDHCEPAEFIADLIRSTSDYIRDAENLV